MKKINNLFHYAIIALVVVLVVLQFWSPQFGPPRNNLQEEEICTILSKDLSKEIVEKDKIILQIILDKYYLTIIPKEGELVGQGCEWDGDCTGGGECNIIIEECVVNV
jgi:hypothetical protein